MPPCHQGGSFRHAYELAESVHFSGWGAPGLRAAFASALSGRAAVTFGAAAARSARKERAGWLESDLSRLAGGAGERLGVVIRYPSGVVIRYPSGVEIRCPSGAEIRYPSGVEIRAPSALYRSRRPLSLGSA